MNPGEEDLICCRCKEETMYLLDCVHCEKEFCPGCVYNIHDSVDLDCEWFCVNCLTMVEKEIKVWLRYD